MRASYMTSKDSKIKIKRLFGKLMQEYLDKYEKYIMVVWMTMNNRLALQRSLRSRSGKYDLDAENEPWH